MNIMILVNKDFEYAGYRSGIEYQMTTGKTPHLNVTSRDTSPEREKFTPRCEYRLEAEKEIHTIKEYCINYFFRTKKEEEQFDVSSNSKIKFDLLKKFFDGLEQKPDYIISVSTSESTSAVQGIMGHTSVNGCVFMGNKFYARDCRKEDLNVPDKEKSTLDIPEPFMESRPLFNSFYEDVALNHRLLSDGMKPLSNYPAEKLFCDANPNYASLGVVNIVNYENYKIADPATYNEFKSNKKYMSLIPEGLETTHSVVKMASADIPVLFISPIVDRYHKFDVDVDDKWGNQNRLGSYNAGVVVANILELFRNKITHTPRKLSEIKLTEIKAGMYVHCEVTKQGWGGCHVQMFDGNDRIMLFEKNRDRNSTLQVIEEVNKSIIKMVNTSDVKITFTTDSGGAYKALESHSEQRDVNGVLKTVNYSINLEDETDDDYNDISINITAWLKKD